MSRLYTEDHEWIDLAGEVATVGITTHAAEQLGDLVFVELPKVGQTIAKGGSVATVESVKAASDVYAPLSGEVVAVNEAVVTDPSLVNGGAEGEAWLIKVKVSNPGETEGLMDADAYKAFAG